MKTGEGLRTKEKGERRKDVLVGNDGRAVQGATTQKEFLRVAEGNPVSYVHPGIFQTGTAEVKLRTERIAPFALKLSTVLPFAEYDRLTREIWVSHLLANSEISPTEL